MCLFWSSDANILSGVTFAREDPITHHRQGFTSTRTISPARDTHKAPRR